MATELEKLFIKIEADTKGLKKSVANLDQDFKGLGKTSKKTAGDMARSFKGAGATLSKSLIIITSVVAALGSIKTAVTAWGVQEKAINSLNASLLNTGSYSQEASEAIQESASRIQSLTTAGDEALIKASATVAQLTNLDATGLADVQKAIVGIADTFFSGNIESAALLVGKSIGSTTNALSRYKIQLDSNATQQEKLNSLLQQTEGFFNVSTANADTLSGRYDQLKNSTGDLFEAFGELITKGFNLKGVYETLTKTTDGFIKILSDNKEAILQVLNAIGALMKASGRLFLEFTKASGKALVEVWGSWLKTFKAIGEGFKSFTLDPILKMINILLSAIEKIGEKFNIDAFKNVRSTIAELSASAKKNVFEFSASLVPPPVKNIFSDLKKDLSRGVEVPTVPVSAGSLPTDSGSGTVAKEKKKQDKTNNIKEQTNIIALKAQELELERQLFQMSQDKINLGTSEKIQNEFELKKLSVDQELANLEVQKSKGQITAKNYEIEKSGLEQKKADLETEQKLIELELQRQQVLYDIKTAQFEQTEELRLGEVELENQLTALKANGATQAEINNKIAENAISEEEINLKYTERLTQLNAQLAALGLTEEQIVRVAEATNQIKLAQDSVTTSCNKTNESLNSVQQAAESIGQTFSDAIKTGIETGEFDLKKFATSILDTFSKLANDIAGSFLKNIFSGAGSGGGGFDFGSLLGFKDGGIIPKFASGGIIKGSGTGRSDSILARVSTGEAVIPAKQTSENLELVKMLINGGIPKFANGGIVGSISPQSSGVAMGGTTNITIKALDSKDVIQTMSQPSVARHFARQSVNAVQIRSNRTLQPSTME